MDAPFVSYSIPDVPPAEMSRRAREFRVLMDGRRSVRQFSSRPVPREVIEEAIRVGGTAPSGAHKQPWTYVVVENVEVRRRIREVAEEEEKRFYSGLAPAEWLRDLAPLGTDWEKEHLTDAPWLVVVFAQDLALKPDGTKGKHYYVNESVGISVGFFLAALRVGRRRAHPHALADALPGRSAPAAGQRARLCRHPHSRRAMKPGKSVGGPQTLKGGLPRRAARGPPRCSTPRSSWRSRSSSSVSRSPRGRPR